MTNRDLQMEVIVRSDTDPSKCMKCGKCSGTCPMYNEMEYHPHQFVAMINEGNLAPLIASDSIYKCLSCFACAERCPRGVEPAKLIEAIRQQAIIVKGGDHLTPNDIPNMLDDDLPQQAIVSAFRKYRR